VLPQLKNRYLYAARNRFHISAGLGIHASMPITNQETKKDQIQKVLVIKLDPMSAENVRVGWS
jgi:hypothetical protein